MKTYKDCNHNNIYKLGFNWVVCLCLHITKTSTLIRQNVMKTASDNLCTVLKMDSHITVDWLKLNLDIVSENSVQKHRKYSVVLVQLSPSVNKHLSRQWIVM